MKPSAERTVASGGAASGSHPRRARSRHLGHAARNSLVVGGRIDPLSDPHAEVEGPGGQEARRSDVSLAGSFETNSRRSTDPDGKLSGKYSKSEPNWTSSPEYGWTPACRFHFPSIRMPNRRVLPSKYWASRFGGEPSGVTPAKSLTRTRTRPVKLGVSISVGLDVWLTHAISSWKRSDPIVTWSRGVILLNDRNDGVRVKPKKPNALACSCRRVGSQHSDVMKWPDGDHSRAL